MVFGRVLNRAVFSRILFEFGHLNQSDVICSHFKLDTSMLHIIVQASNHVSSSFIGGRRFRSIYNYRPQNEDELELKDGDVVYVMEKCDDGWYVGTSQRTKEFGTFPGNYVKPIW